MEKEELLHVLESKCPFESVWNLVSTVGATSDNSHNMGVVGSHLVLHSDYNASFCMFESVEAINHCTDWAADCMIQYYNWISHTLGFS